jgi:hypothetical protein|tara:strand:- start:2214 stop:3143 length:930 start_codon:yes stop_codon:yes gene_type:complete
MMLCLTSMVGIISPVSAQILPEVILECDEDVEINPSPGSSRTGLINCVAENPSMFSETIDITVQSGKLASSAPDTITLTAGSSTDFQVSLKSDEAESPGEILVNITATISQVNGVLYPAGSSDEQEVTVTIIEYSSCETEIGQGGGSFDSGDEISISASINCESNEEGKISYQIHLIQKPMGSSSWPSGFQNIDGDCDVDIDVGDSGENCNFRIGTPSDLEKDWEGCIVIIEKGDVKPNLCPNTNKVDLKIKKKAVGLGIEFGGNESILEQLGITEEQVPVIAGSIGILILIIGGFIYYRRKGQEYEYE